MTKKNRYGKLRDRGIVIFDIPSDTVPKKFLAYLLDKHQISFNLFFNRYILETTQQFLYDELFINDCGGSAPRYQTMYVDILSSEHAVFDGRTQNAVMGEIKLFRDCVGRGVGKTNFLDIPASGTGTRISRQVENPLRVEMHVTDKLDLRVAAGFVKIPLWQYIAELVSEGMLKLYIAYNTNPDEKALIDKNIADDVDSALADRAFSALFERISRQYRHEMNDVYHGIIPKLRTDIDMIALDSVRRFLFS